MKKNIPNAITCLNLLCGCAAVTFAFQGRYDMTAYMTAFSLLFDFADGLMARLLRVHSELGKQLDSLADMVSFGLVPGVIMYHLLIQSLQLECMDQTLFMGKLIPYLGFIITIFSAVRLAKFNLDTRQSDSFIGLPTPANTMVVVSLPMILSQGYSALNAFILNPYFLVFFSFLMSYLLIAEIPLMALKFKTFKWADNKIKYIFILLSLFLMIQFLYMSIPLIIFLYIMISIFSQNPLKKGA